MAKFSQNPTVIIEVDKATFEVKKISRVARITGGTDLIKTVTLASTNKTALDTILATISNLHLTGDGGSPVILTPSAGDNLNGRGATPVPVRIIRSGTGTAGSPVPDYVVPDFNGFLTSIATGGSSADMRWERIDDGGTDSLEFRSRNATEAHFLTSLVNLESFGNWKITLKIKNPRNDPADVGNSLRFGFARRPWTVPTTISGFNSASIGDILRYDLSWEKKSGGTNPLFKANYYQSIDGARTQLFESAQEYTPGTQYEISFEKTDTKLITIVDVAGVTNKETQNLNIEDINAFKALYFIIGMFTDDNGLADAIIESITLERNGHGTGSTMDSDYRILADLDAGTGQIERLLIEGMNIKNSAGNIIPSGSSRLFVAGQNATDLQTSLTAIWDKIKTDEGIT